MAIEELKGQPCPMCKQKTLDLTQQEIEIPYFGKTLIFSMTCANCKYHLADVEAIEMKEPCKYTLEITSAEDMKIRIIKSSQATIKVPYITTITPGPASQGYVTNVEGVFNRIKSQIEAAKDSEEDKDTKKEAWKLLKKINRIMWGQDKSKLIIEDPSGNSAIISEKAVKKKL